MQSSIVLNIIWFLVLVLHILWSKVPNVGSAAHINMYNNWMYIYNAVYILTYTVQKYIIYLANIVETGTWRLYRTMAWQYHLRLKYKTTTKKPFVLYKCCVCMATTLKYSNSTRPICSNRGSNSAVYLYLHIYVCIHITHPLYIPQYSISIYVQPEKSQIYIGFVWNTCGVKKIKVFLFTDFFLFI